MAKDVRKAIVKAKPKPAPARSASQAKVTSAKATPAKVTPAKAASAKPAKAARTTSVKARPSAAKPSPAKPPAVAAKSKATAKPVNAAARPAPKSQPISAPARSKAGSTIIAPRKAEAKAQPASNGAAVDTKRATPAASSKSSVVSAGKAMSKKSGADHTPLKLPEDYRPSEDEPFMGPMQRAYFRHKLQKWKDDIIKETMETLQVLHDDTLQHPDLADRATHETDRALELRARDRQRKLISKIEAAIRRIDDGSYGYCDETGEPISLKRLDARPVATLSLEAQERHERRERVHREE